MKKWRYEVQTDNGRVIKGTNLEAEDQNEALIILQKQGFARIISLEEIDTVSHSISKKLAINSPSIWDLNLFFIELEAFQSAGEPLPSALAGMIPYIKNEKLKKAAIAIRKDLINGEDLYKAFAKHSIFPRICAPLLRVGEEAGALSDTFREIAIYLKRNGEVRREISLALAPVKIFSVFLAIVGLIITNLLAPRVQKVADDLGRPIPAFSLVIYNAIGFMQDHWFLMLAFTCLILFCWKWFIQKYPDKYSQLLLNLPIYKPVYKTFLMYRLSKTLEILRKGGVGDIEALLYASEAVDNIVLKNILIKAHTKARRDGYSITAAICENDPSNLVNHVLIQLLNTGERTGSNSEMLEKAGQFFDDDLQMKISRFKQRVGPLFLSPMAVVIIIIVAAIYYPMIDMVQGVV